MGNNVWLDLNKMNLEYKGHIYTITATHHYTEKIPKYVIKEALKKLESGDLKWSFSLENRNGWWAHLSHNGKTDIKTKEKFGRYFIHLNSENFFKKHQNLYTMYLPEELNYLVRK